MNMHAAGPAGRAPAMSERRTSIYGALMVVIGPLSLALFTPAMPELVEVFGTTEAMVKYTLSAYFAGFAVTQLVCGPLSDAYGRKPVTLAFLSIYVAASLLAVLAPTIEVLITARLLQGVGAAVGVAVSRALVRDLFTGDASARIMNLIGLIMGFAPALAPTLGGFLLELTGWQSIFVVMLVGGAMVLATIQWSMAETVVPDPSRFRPRALVRSYRALLGDRYFLLASFIIGGGTGALFTQATVLPFILMARAGLSPSQFGLAMLMQSMPFFFGALLFRAAMRRFGASGLIPAGMACMTVGSVAVAVSLFTLPPTFLSVMVPVACFTFGLAFIMPALSTATVAPFPHMAGAASALSGFIQMGSGFLGGVILSTMGDPVVGMGVLIPAMGLGAVAAWLAWRRMPEPALARAVMPRREDGAAQ